MRRRKIIGSLSALLVIVMIFAFAFLPMRLMQNVNKDAARVSQSHQLRKEIRDISDVLRSIIFEHRNYVFTNDVGYRQKRDLEITRLTRETDEAFGLMAGNDRQLSRIQELKSSLSFYFLPFLLQDDMLPEDRHERERFAKIMSEDTLLKPLFSLIHEMDREEEGLLSIRQSELAKTVKNDSLISIGIGLAALALLLSMYALYKIDVEEKEKTAQYLRIANSEVEKANQMKSAFLANMSHEIRTPLGAVLGFADLLSAPTLSNEERLRYAEVIRRNGKSLSLIIDDILDLSKVEAGKITLERIEFNLEEILFDLSAAFVSKAENKGIIFSIEIDPGVPAQYISDPTRIRQILLNIVGNAIKFTDDGSVVLEVSFSPTLQGNYSGTLLFTVCDSGIGIPAEQQKKLFQPFAQADGSTTRQFGGTGLGLALSRRLARLLGGNIEILESIVDEGTTFLVVLPVYLSNDSRTISQNLNLKQVPQGSTETFYGRRSAEERQTVLKNIHILLAEDAPDNQLLITHILESLGARVSVVGNGRDAVTSALLGDKDLILMDIQMPVLGGHEAAHELRTKGYNGPIVALTAHAMIEERQKSQNSGCNDFLTKPIDSEKLISTILHYTQSSNVSLPIIVT